MFVLKLLKSKLIRKYPDNFNATHRWHIFIRISLSLLEFHP